MARNALGLTLAAVLVVLDGGVAKAQFYYSYAPGSTVWGDELRGWGAASIGMGLFNLNTAQAEWINAETWMRLNQYRYQAVLEQNRRLAAHEAQRKVRRASSWSETRTRINDHPEPRDIFRGDSLNSLAGIVAGMNVHPSAVRAARVDVPGGLFQKLPLVHAPTQARISAARLDIQDDWPLLLRGPAPAQARRRYEAALDAVHTALLDRRSSSQGLDELDRSVAALRTYLGTIEASADPAEVRQARLFLERVSRTVEMLRDPLVEKAFLDVTSYLGTSVADLVTFMQRHDLRFAPAADVHEKELFEDLYALLSEYREKLAAIVEGR